jgi:hypothetical protein
MRPVMGDAMLKINRFTIIPTELSAPADIERNFSTINAPLGNLLQHVGLPTENLLAPRAGKDRRSSAQSRNPISFSKYCTNQSPN